MNTTTCCTPTVIPTHTSLLRRWSTEVEAFWRALRADWQAQSRRRAERLLLQSLSDSTLRDIGLAERLPEPRYTLGVLDQERGRWS